MLACSTSTTGFARAMVSSAISLLVLATTWSPAAAFLPSTTRLPPVWHTRKLHSRNIHVMASSASSMSPTSSQQTLFDWTTEWYPVSPVQDLAKDQPNKITLLGMDFCVWYHHDSDQWRAFADVCPHRLVPLSEGRIESNGVLQCAYHGWEFDETGDCVRIPQLADDSTAITNPRACATSFPVRVEQGLVWIFPTANVLLASTKEPALIPELDDPENVDATNFFCRDMPYSWDILVENLCDPSHVPFAHHSYMNGADRNLESLVLDLVVTEETSGGFEARKDPKPPGEGMYDVKFQAPCLSQNIVMDSDVVFLCSQDEYLSNNDDSRYYMPAKCDTMVSAFRKWLTNYAGGKPEWLGIPAARSSGEPLGWIRPQQIPLRGGRDALLDRYRQHTDICSSCRQAHKSLYKLGEGLTVGGTCLLAVAAAVQKRRIPIAVAGAFCLVASRLLLRPLIARFEGMPWPRKQWMAPTPIDMLRSRRDEATV